MMFGISKLAAIVLTLGAGPQAQQAAQSATVPAAMQGDWVLAGPKASGRLRITGNGVVATFEAREVDSGGEGTNEERYRISGALGAAWTIESVDGGKTPIGDAPRLLPLRARLLPVSATVALWWQPHREAVFAYRRRSVPQAFQGKYIIDDKGTEDLRSIEVGADSIVRQLAESESEEDGSDPNYQEPILAVTDADTNSLRVILGDSRPHQALRIELHGRRARLVQERLEEPDTYFEGCFVPATGGHGGGVVKGSGARPNCEPPPAVKTRKTSKQLPPGVLGAFRLSSLTKNEEARLTVGKFEWSLRPLGGATGVLGAPEISGELSPGVVRVLLERGYSGQASFTLRRLDDNVSLLERNSQVFVMYRPDAPPPWAPSVGLADDVQVLCRELEAAGSLFDDRAIKAAFERAGRSAHSDVMRSIVEAIVGMPTNLRAAALERGLIDAGEPIPACPGVDRLQSLPGQRRSLPDDD